MNSAGPSTPRLALPLILGSLCLAGVVATLMVERHWLDRLRDWASRSFVVRPANEPTTADGAADDHDHDHDHHGHVEENSIALSPQARRSIGLQEGNVDLSTFHRTITVPGMVVERRGRSRFNVIAPMTGYLTKILAAEGEAIAAEQPLFEVRITHEELVGAQTDLLRTTAEIDVARREIARLEGIGPEGLIPTKVLLEHKYELHRLEAVQLAQRQALLLHGLTESQVEAIVTSRTLLGSLVVRAPGPDASQQDSGTLVVQELAVDRGQHVTAGDTLAVLVDHGSLLVEGDAFEQDILQITEAAATGKPITAVLDSPRRAGGRVEGLRIAYVADRVAADSRTLRFFVTLPNAIVGAPRAEGTSRFVTWRYKPGQRMQIEVPVEEWPERIVLPADAVAQEGIENYVFRAHGDHFDRAPVHVEYRDPQWVVIANDGTLLAGDRVAMSAAQQLQLALRNKSGGGVDPHAGHNH